MEKVINTVYPKQTKQPKCSEEFWRREKRVKVKPNWEIIRLKEDRAKLQSELKTLNRLIIEKSEEFADACVMVAGLVSTQKFGGMRMLTTLFLL